MNTTKTSHAVYCTLRGATALLTLSPDKKYVTESVDLQDLQDLMGFGVDRGITHLWVMCEDIPSLYDEDEWDVLFHWNRKTGKPTTITARRKSSKWMPQVNIIFARNCQYAGTEKRPGWMRTATPQELLVTIFYIEQMLGVAVGGSAPTTGWKFLEKLNAEHEEWLKDHPNLNLELMHFGREAASDLYHDREPTDEEMSMGYLHKFDMKSAYLYAAAFDLFMGVGTPEHQDDVEAMDSFFAKKVGVWRCTVHEVERPQGMPAIDYGEWMAGPLIKLLMSQGHQVEIEEGYIFPEKHQTLKTWANHLFGCLKSYATLTERWKHPVAREYARESIKKMYVSTIGLTAYRKFEPDEETDKRRVDFKMQVVARLYELMYLIIDKVRKEHGATPIMVYMDALYYISDEPNGRTAFPSLMDRKKEGELGAFKYEGSLALTPEVKAILTGDYGTNTKLELLNKIGWKING